jgi:hypothetical protein
MPEQLAAPVPLPLMKSLLTLRDDYTSQTIGFGGEAMNSLTCLELYSFLVIHFYGLTVPRKLKELENLVRGSLLRQKL